MQSHLGVAVVKGSVEQGHTLGATLNCRAVCGTGCGGGEFGGGGVDARRGGEGRQARLLGGGGGQQALPLLALHLLQPLVQRLGGGRVPALPPCTPCYDTVCKSCKL